MMKLKLLILMTGVMSWSTVTADDFTADGIKYSGDEATMSATVTGLADGNEATDIVIPASVNGYSVDAIGRSAFHGAPIETVVLPNSIKTMKNSAFRKCPYLTSINIPASVTTVEENVFFNDSCLQTVTFDQPSSLTEIAFGMFDNTGITSIDIPSSVTAIRQYAFYECKNLKSIVIPKSVTLIEYDAAHRA